MSLAIREQLHVALASRLATALPDFSQHRNPQRAITGSDIPAVVLLDGGQSRLRNISGVAEYTLRPSIEIYVGSVNSGPALSAAYAGIVGALTADVTLGGLAKFLTEGDLSEPETVRDEGHEPFMGAALSIEVEYWTLETDVTQLGP